MARKEMRGPIPAVETIPACKTCPLWQATEDRQGVCHKGPLAMSQGRALFGQTAADDWCEKHPAAPKL